MSILDKQMLLRDLETRLGDFIPANQINQILAAADEALLNFEVTSAPTAGPDGDSEDLLRFFLDAKRVEGKSEKTLSRYSYILKRLQTGTGVPFSRMTVHHIRGFYSAERARGIASSTLEGNRQVYSSFFGWLTREGLIQHNPMVNLASIKQPKVVRKPFDAAELAKLEKAAEDPRDRALIAFLESTGCRVSEICQMNTEDIEESNNSLIVHGKGDKERRVWFDKETAMWLEEYLLTRTDSDPALFIGRTGKRLTPDGIRCILNRIAARAGVENVHPHRFRRTRATTLINRGMAVQDVATVLGHSKLDTTMRYIYIDEKLVENNFRKFA